MSTIEERKTPQNQDEFFQKKKIFKNLSAVDIVAKFFKWLTLIVYLLIALLPMIWLAISSFKTNIEFQLSPFSLPAQWQFSNYMNAINMTGLPSLFLHSIIVAVMALVINLAVTTMASFVISREEFFGRKVLYNLIVAGVLVPIISLMVPYFTLIHRVGLYDTLWALGFTYASVNIPISIFLLTSFMRAIPKELEEAAIIDGASFIQRYTKIVFPLSKVGIVTAGTFIFIFAWNEFIFALLLTSSEAARTLQLGIRFFTSQFISDYTSMYAALVITIIPSIFIYIFFHEKIIRGLTSGAVKG
ncbi:MAG: carbohydrate ABC transporter permease [Spirochaetia bacterium]